MTQAAPRDPGLPWHGALIYAITGRRRDGIGNQTVPDIELLAAQLNSEPGSRAALLAHAHDRAAEGHPWPHPVPPDLMAGLGYAQFSAALSQLIRSLDLQSSGPATALLHESGSAERKSADLRRLLDEVPPHHGN